MAKKPKRTTRPSAPKKAVRPATKGKTAPKAKSRTVASKKAVKKAPAKKVTTKAAPKKAATKKVVKKAAVKKAAPRKTTGKAVAGKTIKKAAPKKAAVKVAAKKTAPKKAVVKKVAVKKAAPKKAAVKKAAPKRPVAGKAVTKKIAPKKAAAGKKTAAGPVAEPKPKAPVAARAPEKKTLKQRFQMEFEVNSTPTKLYELISMPSGFSEWYCDDVNVKNDIYSFIWEGEEERAAMIGQKQGEVIRFHWEEDEDPNAYFEFRIRIDAMTNDVALIVTDHAWPHELETAKALWQSQIGSLARVLGA